MRTHTAASSRQQIIPAYLAGKSMKAVAALVGCSESACWRHLLRNGFAPRSRSDARRRYALDEHYFDEIASESQAYWLGFLTADGGIVEDSLVLNLQARDTRHVFKFRRAIAAQHPVRQHQSQGHCYARFAVYSKRLIRSLARLGLRERKSHEVAPCPNVPQPLLPHYWRGVFDGDGWLGPRAGGGWIVGFCGNKKMCQGFHAFASAHLSSRAAVRPHASIFMVTYAGQIWPKRLVSLLYENASIFLDRKMRLACRLASTCCR